MNLPARSRGTERFGIITPSETLVLIDMFFNAPTDANVTIKVDGDMLICTNIPPGTLEGFPSWPEIVTDLSPESEDLILGVIQNFGGIVSNVNAASAAYVLGSTPDDAYGVHEAVKMISGRPSRADLVTLAVTLMVQNQWPGVDCTVSRIDACWGSYGSLPLLQVTLPDAYILLDTTNGLMAGPFEPGSGLHANALLAQHDVWDQSNPAYFNSQGCQLTVAAIWNNGPPCWFCSPTITWDPPQPGGQTFHCSDQGHNGDGDVRCVCSRYGTITIGTPPVTYRVREVCDCGGAGTCNRPNPGAGPGTGWSPGTPPTGCTTSTCTTQYSY